ncbi:MAG: alkaline phosphatase family protein [Thermodesulfobacteriota bacterium]|nr:alkaline phosphatase family protein [Thermodesulfobacteriota bacterium]
MKIKGRIKKIVVGVIILSLLFVFRASQSQGDSEPDFLSMIQRNCVPNAKDRSPELYIVYQEDVLTSSEKNTTFACSHGFPWESDTCIPLILYGKGIKRGAILKEEASLEDITQTLAKLLFVDPPEESNGRVLTEALKLWHKNDTKEPKLIRKLLTPRVALVFTLDQCRADYLTNPQIKDALAFTRSVLAGKGAQYLNARLSYSVSRTAVSHAVIGTGATPGINGIIGNNINLGSDFPLAFDDQPLHSMNMFNLLTPTLADVMDLEKFNNPVIISMSPYARAALGMGGHGAAYSPQSDHDIIIELLSDVGLPYTNDEYFSLPMYLKYSKENPIRIDQWLLDAYSVDIHNTYWTESTVVKDNSPYTVPNYNTIKGPQGVFPDGTLFSFSHPSVTDGAEQPVEAYQLWDESVPFPNNDYYEDTMYTPFFQLWAVDMLLKTMEAEGVGMDCIPDLVYYNFKCLDKVGHRYGVNSPEVYTILYYIDYCLKKIKYWLDKNIGKNNYVMIVTADHGAHNSYGDRILYTGDLFDAVESRFSKEIILNDPSEGKPFDDMIYLDQEILDAKGHTQEDVAGFVEESFSDHVYEVYTKDEIFQNQE